MRSPRNPQRPRGLLRLPCLVMACALVAGCSPGKIPGVYRLDIQQGNVVDQDMLAQLEPGMAKRKVRFILGTPLITDAFNQDRWDYFYSFEPGSGERMQRRISLFFDGDRLARIEGDVQAGHTQPAGPERREKVVTVPDQPRDGGFFGTLARPFKDDDTPAKPETDEEMVARPAEAEVETEADSAEEGGFLSRFMEGFPGKKDAAEPVEALEDAGEPEPSAAIVEQPAPEAEHEEETTEEGGFLSRIAERFRGRSDSEAETDDDVDSSLPEDSQEPSSEPEDQADAMEDTAATESESAASEDDDGGFLRRLMDRFRIKRKPEADTETSAPADQVSPSTGDRADEPSAPQ